MVNRPKLNVEKMVMILRAVSGSGKSTFAESIKYLAGDECEIATADDYFIDKEGNYNFDVRKLGEAHRVCREKFEEALKQNKKRVICANTNTDDKTVNLYIDLAKKYGYPYVVLVVEKRHDFDNCHNVPQEALKKQEMQLRNSIKLI